MSHSRKQRYREVFTNTLMIGWILVKLTLVSALLSPGVRELVYAGF
jgi:hypothetical protein